MSIKSITEEQKAVLNAAATGGTKSPASIYPQPTVQPVDAFGVLHPDTTGVDNVEIIVDYDGMPNNDILSFYWNGDLSIPAVVADTKPKRVPVPAGLVIAAANKTINVIYSVIDDANPSGVPSDVHTQVIEKYTPPVYPAPTVIEAPNDILNPMDGLLGVTLLVKYDGMQTSDLIGISWDGKNSYPQQNGNASGEVTFNIPAADVGAVIGRTIAVFYAVVRAGDPYLSEELDLVVEMIPETELQAPKIIEAPGDVLDVSALTADANLYVEPWPFIGAGQRIWLRFEGTAENGSAHNWLHPTWQGLTLTSGGKPTTTVALDQLKQLKDGSELLLIFEVSFDGGATKLEFPQRLVTVNALILLSENFTGVPETGPVKVGIPIVIRSMVITLISGSSNGMGYVYVGKHTLPVPGMSDGYGLVAQRNGGSDPVGLLLRLDFKWRYSRVRFAYTTVVRPTLISYYDVSGRLVGQRSISNVEGRPNIWVDFYAPTGEHISRVELFETGASPSQTPFYTLDDFTFEV